MTVIKQSQQVKFRDIELYFEMNLDEAVELLRVISAISVEDQPKSPEIHIFHNIGEEYTLHIKANSLNTEFRERLDKIVQTCKLGIRQSNHYLIIYSCS